MLKRISLLVLAVLTVLFCTGCEKMLESEYISVTPYEEKNPAGEEHGTVDAEVHSYAELRSKLVSLVENCTEHSVFSVTEYDNAVNDMSKACMEVTRNTAMGIYAVDYMTHSYTKFPGYYEMELYITYKHSVEELFSIQRASSAAEAVEMLRDMLAAGEERAVIQVSSSIISAEYLCRRLDDIYYSMPGELLIKPVLTATEYSSGSMDKIIELKADYILAKDQIERRLGMLNERVEEICAGVSGETQAERLSQACAEAFGMAGNYNVYFSLALEKTAFDAVCGGGNNPEAIAMGVQLLCSKLGIESSLVFGTKGRREYVWNAVNVDGTELFVDALSQDLFLAGADGEPLPAEYVLRSEPEGEPKAPEN